MYEEISGRLRSPNLSETIREELVRLIVGGVLKPGDRLNEVHLAERLGVSRGPVREAARELEGSGLIVSRARQGFYVTDFTAAQILDLYEVKDWIDQALIEDFITYMSSDVAQKILADVDRIETQGKNAFTASLFAFRERMVGYIHNRYLAEHALGLYRKLYIATALIDVEDEQARIRLTINTLRDFWTAIVARDRDTALAVMRADGAHWEKNLVPRFKTPPEG